VSGDIAVGGSADGAPRYRSIVVRCSRQSACTLLALCDMKTLYLRNVPEDVVARLQRLADRDGTSVGAVAVRELSDVSRRADNPGLIGELPDLGIDVLSIVEGVERERARR
jgi:hypothetical protein